MPGDFVLLELAKCERQTPYSQPYKPSLYNKCILNPETAYTAGTSPC